MKTVIIDGRLLQTSAWLRGMGRYLLGLMRGMYDQEDRPRVILIQTDALEVSEERDEVIAHAFPGVEIHRLSLANNGFPAADRENTRVLDSFIRTHGLQGATFLQSSLFSFDYSPLYPTLTYNTCIFYDMIPLKFWDLFRNYYAEHEYFTRYKFIYSADKLFAISNSVKDDLVQYLGFEADDVVNIDGAKSPDFLNEVPAVSEKSPREYKYIMLPGGDAPHKNLLRAIRGFDLFNANFGDMYKLVITSFYSEDNQRRMRELSPNVELSGQISDEELHQLYAHSEMILFPSLDEGLGMPILEAVDYGKKVACSAVPIFKELSKDAFYLFDPYDPTDIARAMVEALGDQDTEAHAKKYAKINDKFTWKRSAAALLGADTTKAKQPHHQRHSIIVEQDGSPELARLVGQIVRRSVRSGKVDLFVDSVSEYDDLSIVDSPLIFNHFLDTKDIVDAPKRASKHGRTVIFTKKSKYTPALVRDEDEVLYLGTTAKKVQAAFKKDFKEQA